MSLISNAVSGLQVSQNALRTTGHNIANANTEGFSRQRASSVARPEQRLGDAGFVGSGAITQSIERIVDEFVTGQLRTDTTAFNDLDAFNTNIGKIDRLYADGVTGLAQGLSDFFAAVQNGADDPSSTPARQLIITQAQSLAVRFSTLDDRLMDTQQNVNRELRAIAEAVNGLTGEIGQLNRAIGDKTAADGNPPNDLLDQRDQALLKLSELISIQTVREGSGNINVFTGSGAALVFGFGNNGLSVSNRGEVLLGGGASQKNITDRITGGQAGGLIRFREEVLLPSRNDLGRIALALADEFNQLQKTGLDLEGDLGQNFFTDINDDRFQPQRIQPSAGNGSGDQKLSLDIADARALTTSDYRFEIIEGTRNFAITRLEDNQLVRQGGLSGAFPETIEFDGLALTLESGTFQGGDEFILQPTASGAQQFETLISRPEDLAFASPIRTLASGANQGGGSISQGEVLSLAGTDGERLPTFTPKGELSPPLLIQFTSPTSYQVLDNSNPSNPKPLEPPIREQTFIPGRENALFTADPGETRIIADGARLGLPEGHSADVVATGGPAQNNGYPIEQMNFSITDPSTGATSTQIKFTQANASAAQTADLLSQVPGVSVNAFTQAIITDLEFENFSSPLQISLNGEALIETLAGGDPATNVPNPQTDEGAFLDYLAGRINANDNLSALGFRATSGANAQGEPELRLVASSGVDMDVRLEADNATQNQLSVNDGTGNPDVRLSGQGGTSQSIVTVGGQLDITLADGVSLQTAPTVSQLLGDSSDPDFAQSSFLGIQASIKGNPEAGDNFSIEFNSDASNDNRNAQRMAALQTQGVMGGGEVSFGDAYGRLVEEVGTQSASARNNTQAAQSVLEQTQSLRDTISGVNLDEEAANLIKFEQVFNANSRVISIARDLFQTLLNAV